MGTMPRWLASFILWSAPALILAGTIAIASFTSAFRRGFGAHTTMPGLGLLALGLVLIIHGGYLAAPFLAPSHRVLPLALILPVAAIDTVILLAVWSRIEGGPTTHRTVALVVGVVVLVLWLPVAVLIPSRLR